MTTSTARKAKTGTPSQPCEYHDGIPVYRSGEAPEALRTETQLKGARLKLSPDQKPHAYLRMYRRGTGWMRVALYSPGEAMKMRPLSAHQQRQKLARRTCILCAVVKEEPLAVRSGSHLPQSGPICWDCNRRHRERHERTCDRCGTEFQERSSVWWARCQRRLCHACDDEHERGYEVAVRLLRRHCPDCTAQTATQQEIEEADASTGRAQAVGFPRICEPCQAERDRQAAESQRAAERRRWDQLGPVRRWAREVVAQPDAFAILDTETTGLDWNAKVVEISVTDGAGNPLLDTLVNPGAPIPDEATSIHGINDEDVAGAPRFEEILPALTEALSGRRVVIYNRAYDEEVLAYELDRHHRKHAPVADLPERVRHPAAAAWMNSQQWDRCAMLAYAVHVGDWSDYWDGWSWQRLNGGHRALGDCRRVAEIIREMAEVPDPF